MSTTFKNNQNHQYQENDFEYGFFNSYNYYFDKLFERENQKQKIERQNFLLEKMSNVQIIASGTSYHSGLIMKKWIEDLLSIPCNVSKTSEYRDSKFIYKNDTILIVIDGEEDNIELFHILMNAKKKNQYSGYFTITSHDSDLLKKESDSFNKINTNHQLYSNPFINELYILFNLALKSALLKGNLKEEEATNYIQELNEIYNNEFLSNYLKEQFNKIISNVNFSEKDYVFVAKTYLYPIAKEMSHQIRERTSQNSYCEHLSEFKYLKNRYNKENEIFVSFAHEDLYYDEFECDLYNILKNNKQLILFGTKEIHHPNAFNVKMPKCSQILLPFLYNVPLQLLSDYLDDHLIIE